MKKNKKVLYIILIIIILLITNSVSINVTSLLYEMRIDRDYEKVDLGIEENDIEYCTVYKEDWLGVYKVYKIKKYYSDSMDEIKKRLNNDRSWSKNKFYEYVMSEFYEVVGEETSLLDREDLYYYHKNGIYSIFDLKNTKLYYLDRITIGRQQDYNNILGIKINSYIDKEVYSVRGGPQHDGTDYYLYKFDENKANEVEKILSKNNKWSNEKLNDELLESFEHNEEVKSITNGYYHYEKVCRTSNQYKAKHFTDEEATGYEVIVYDCDTNMFYYYWTSI